MNECMENIELKINLWYSEILTKKIQIINKYFKYKTLDQTLVRIRFLFPHLNAFSNIQDIYNLFDAYLILGVIPRNYIWMIAFSSLSHMIEIDNK